MPKILMILCLTCVLIYYIIKENRVTDLNNQNVPQLGGPEMDTDKNIAVKLGIMAILIAWITGCFDSEPVPVKIPAKTPGEIREAMKSFPGYNYVPAELKPPVYIPGTAGQESAAAPQISTPAIPPPEFDPPVLSVSRIDGVTSPAGWNMATISYQGEKFTLYYNSTEERMMNEKGTGSDRISITYHLTDEVPRPNDRKSFLIELSYSEGLFKMKFSERLRNKDTKSRLRQLGKNGSETAEVFEGIFRRLEEITPPPPLYDE